jgi:hypothetical protein
VSTLSDALRAPSYEATLYFHLLVTMGTRLLPYVEEPNRAPRSPHHLRAPFGNTRCGTHGDLHIIGYSSWSSRTRERSGDCRSDCLCEGRSAR